MSYEQPAKGESFSPRDHPEWVGRLLIVYPTEVATVTFDDGPSEVVTADVLFPDLTDPATGKPKIMLGARIGGKALVPAIKKYVGTGDAALGRLKQLPPKGAKSGAFVLDDHTDAEIQLATNTEAQFPGWRNPGTYGQPAATAPPTGAVSAAPATATGSAGPWFATDTALLQKLLANGVANATTLDHATAQLIGASF